MKLRYTIHPPQLVNRDWSDANEELQRFLKYLLDANDATQTNIKELNEELDDDDSLRRSAPAAHTHGSEDLLGLEALYRRRPPSSHTHLNTDLPNSLPTDGSRPLDLEPPIPTRVGSLYWDATDETMAIVLPRGVVLQTGQETLLLGYNNTGATIPNGTVVKLVGSSGQRVRIGVASALVHNDVHSAIGVVTEDAGIGHQKEGFITIRGLVRNVNTSLWADGTPLYLGVAGALTSTFPPKPGHVLHVAVVVKGNSGGAGSIYVSLGVAERFDELTDVNITSPVTGDVPVYDGVNLYWKNVSLTSSVGILPVKPHTHLVSDVLGAGTGSGGGDPLESFRARPHTHTEADLMNVVTVDNTGSPGTGLTLGDFILASQIFGF